MSKFFTDVKKTRFLYLILGLSAQTSRAEPQEPKLGGATSGGGDVLICRGTFGIPHVFFADTLDLFKTDNGGFSKSNGVLGSLNKKLKKSPEEVLEILTHATKAIDGDLSKAFQSALKNLKFVWVKNIEELDGDNIRVPENCTKKQLAIQDIKSGSIRVHKSRYESLTNWEKAFFQFHEAFIRIRNPGLNSSPVRKEVFELVNSYSFSLFAMLLLRIETQTKWDEINPEQEIKATFDYLRARKSNQKATFDVQFSNAYVTEIIQKYGRKEDWNDIVAKGLSYNKAIVMCLSENELLVFVATYLGNHGQHRLLLSKGGAVHLNQTKCTSKDWKKGFNLVPEVRRYFSIKKRLL